MNYKAACTNCNSVKLNVFAGVNTKSCDDDLENTPLHHCGGLRDARAFVERGMDVNARNEAGETPLMTNEDVAVCQFLIEHGAQVDAVDEWGNTALLKAQSADKQRLLIQSGADIGAVNDYRRTLLMNPRLNFEIAAYLLEHGADVEARDVDNKTPLMFAGNQKIAALYIKHGASVASVDVFGNTPLMYAQSPEIVHTLVNAGARLNYANKDQMTPLMRFHNDPELVDLFLNAGVKASGLNSLMENALFNIENVTSLKRLVSAGANINRKNYHGQTPIMTAKSREVLEAMIELGADLNHLDKDGNSVLRYANEACFDVLVAKGLDPKGVNKYGRTLLMLTRSKSMVSRLIALGVDVNAMDGEGNNALSYANEETAPILISSGCNVNHKNHNGVTPLMHHARDSSDAVLKQLVEAGAHIHATDHEGDNALCYANNRITMRYLIEAGAEINEQDIQGATPLHFAACCKMECARELIEHGADVKAKDVKGNTPYDYALKEIDSCGMEVIEYLSAMTKK